MGSVRQALDAVSVVLHALLIRHGALVLALLLVVLENASRRGRRATYRVELLIADALTVRTPETWATLAAAAGALAGDRCGSARDEQDCDC